MASLKSHSDLIGSFGSGFDFAKTSISVSVEPSMWVCPCFFFPPLCLTEPGGGVDMMKESKRRLKERGLDGSREKAVQKRPQLDFDRIPEHKNGYRAKLALRCETSNLVDRRNAPDEVRRRGFYRKKSAV